MQFGRKKFLPLLLALSMLLSLLPIPAAAFQTEPMEIWGSAGQAPAPAAPFSTEPFVEPEQSGQPPFATGPFTEPEQSGQAPFPAAPFQAEFMEEPEQSGQAVSDGELPAPEPRGVEAASPASPFRLFNAGPVIESSGKMNFSATIKWNDNADTGATNAVKRPAIQPIPANYTLHFSYTYQGNTVSGSVAADFDKLGLTQAPAPTLSADGDSAWIYSLSGLPAALKITTTPEGEEPQTQTCNVTYTLWQEPFNGYLPATPSEAGNGQTITNTVTQAWRGTIRWFDDKGHYQTRPEASEVAEKTRIYRYVPGETTDTPLEEGVVTLDTGTVQTDSEGRHFYEVTLSNAPAYDETGLPYTYYIEPYNTTQEPDAGAYTPLYVNEDNYASQTNALYLDGTATFTLTNTTGFAVNKDWSDGNNQSRPANVKLYLYRVSVKMEGDTPVFDIDTKGPAPGYDSMIVPAADGPIELAPPGSLPMYDASGCKYVYFAKEVGLPTGRDYHFIINNDGSPESEAIRNAFDEQKTTYLSLDGVKLETPTYVLSDGTITNKLIAAAGIPVTKEFKAQAMQNMGGASVTMQLQWSSDGGTDWQDVLTKEAAELSGTTTPLLHGVPTVTIDGFSAERMSLTATGPVVDKYDADGKKVAYRWVERSMTISGEPVLLNGDWTQDPSQPGTYTYGAPGTLVSTGNVAPGVGNTSTTAYFRPTMTVGSDGSTSVTNTLVGKTQVQVKKTWSGTDAQGDPITGPPDGTTVTVRLRRDDGRMSGGTGENTLYYTDGTTPVENITLHGAEAQPWTAMWDDLVRYDGTGKEYTYAVTEIDVSGGTWTTDVTYAKSVASDGGMERFTQLTANVSNSTGPGEGLEFEVEKQWLDGGDLLTRQPVNVGLYRIRSSDGALLDTSVKVAERTLNAANNWWHKFSIPKEGDDTVDNYVVKELSAAGILADYGGNSDSAIYTAATTDFDDTYPYDKKIGTLGENDPQGLLGYVYNIYIQRRDTSATGPEGPDRHADWQISNQRTGVMTIELNKTWRAGGDAPAAEFKLTRTGGTTGTTPVDIETVTLGSGGKVAPTAGSSGVMIATYTFRGAASDGLLKYDTLGETYSYDLKEISVGGEPIGSGGSVTLPSTGDRYATGISLSKIDIKGGGVTDGKPNHHTGDVYTYAAGNTKVDTYSLAARKLWRDSGSSGATARPDIYFNVYRVADDYKYDGTTLEALAKEKNTEKLAQGLKAALDAEPSQATLLTADKLWNTDHNDWYWSCDLGSVQRYDAMGNRYIYFLVEKTSGNAGTYQSPVYYNAAYDTPSVQWRPKDGKELNSSQEVFDVSLDDMKPYCGDVLILADGTNSGTDGYSDYYSGTVMNYQQENRTVSFRKIWKMPAGWPYLTDQMPTITVELWRTTKPIRDQVSGEIKKTCTKAELEAAENRMVKVSSVALSNPFTHTFTETDPGVTGQDAEPLARYDEWGNAYYYYLYEKTTLVAYASDMIAFDTGEFFITNTYEPRPPHVEVTVQKTWTSQMTGVFVRDLAPATFKLYARMTSGGNMTGNAILMSTMTLDPPSSGNVTTGDLTGKFVYLTGSAPHPAAGATGVTYAKLPYMAPNGNPFAYWVEEVAPPNGYTVAPATRLSDVELTQLDDELYTGATEENYTNTYTADITSSTFTKSWADGNTYIDNAAYRPAKVKFDIYRRIAGGEGEPAKDAAGNEITVILSDGVWSKTVTNLPAYDPDGKAYTYYVHAEALLDDSEQPVTTGLYTASGTGTRTVTNTLKTVSRTAKKTWKNSATGAALGWTVFNELRLMGALPYAVGFVVQSKAADESAWSYVSAKANTTDSHIITIGSAKYVGRQYVTANMDTQAKFDAFADAVTFAMLPECKPDGTTAIDYRVAEVVWESESSTPQVITPGAADAAFAGGTAAIASDGTVYTATNTLALRRITLEKTWVDDGNRENTRPGSVTMTVSKAGGSGGFSRALTGADKTADGGGNVWASDAYVPAAPVMRDAYTVTETLPTGWAYTYTPSGPVWTDDTCAFTNTYDLTHHTRATLSLEATKTFAGDEAWAGITRPDVELSLQYRDQADTQWLAIDQNNIAEFAASDGGVYPPPTRTLTGQTSETVTWEKMYRYWKLDDAGGTAKPIQYRVAETLSGAPYTSAPAAAQAFTGAAGAGVLTAAITNTLTPDTSGIKLEKTWLDGKGDAIPAGTVEALIGLGALPEKLSFKLQYSSDGTTWLDAGSSLSTTLDTVELIAGKQWDIHLPTHDKDGSELQYRAVETGAVFKGSATEIAASALGNITLGVSSAVKPGETAEVRNTYGQYIEVSAAKTWDQGAYAGVTHPAAAKVQLYRDGAAYGAPVELTKAENWAHTWTLLPQYQNGSKTLSQYTVKELDQDGNAVADGGANGQYTVTYGGTQAGGLTITNTYAPGELTINATKAWDDNDDPYGLRPSEVELTLWATSDGRAETQPDQAQWSTPAAVVGYTPSATQTLRRAADGSWGTVQWTVPSYVYDQQMIYYRVSEESPQAGYTATLSDVVYSQQDTGSASRNVTVTNTLTAVTYWTVALEFDGDDMKQAVRDKGISGVEVRLQYRKAGATSWTDAARTGGEAELNATNDWKHTFANLLPGYAYRVVSRSLTESDGTIPTQGHDGTQKDEEVGHTGPYGYISEYDPAGDPEGRHTLIIMTFAKGDLRVTKVWRGGAPAGVEVQLWQGGTDLLDTVLLDPSNGWSRTWTELPVFDANGDKYQYELKEISNLSRQYTVTVSPARAELTEGTTTDVRVTNTYISPDSTGTRYDFPVMPSGFGGVRIHKTVTGPYGGAGRFNFTMTLSDMRISGRYGDLLFTNGVAQFSLPHDGSVTANGLPAGVEYTITEHPAAGYISYAQNARGFVVAGQLSVASFENRGVKPIPQTSDDNALVVLPVALGVSLLGLIACLIMRRRMGKGTKGKEARLRAVMLLICCCFAATTLANGALLCMEVLRYKDSADTYKELTGFVAYIPQAAQPGEMIFQDARPDLETSTVAVDFAGLRQTGPDVVAWLLQEDTALNYPIVQGRDNDYYLRRLYNGATSKAGSLFMDYENKAGFTDGNTIVYGHNMRDGSMFASLLGYAEQAYYDEHKTMRLVTEDGAYTLRIFAAFRADPAESGTISSPWTIAWEDKAAYGAWLAAMGERSLVQSGFYPTPDSRVMTLSTCTRDGNGRFVVIGELVGVDEA